jgi:sigma-E factor negative regulatory protein RseA
MKDQLSALMDGEFDAESSEHIITSAKSGGELNEAWQHYHLIGDVMRGNCEMPHDFCAQVMQAIDSEPTVLSVRKKEASKLSQQRRNLVKTSKFWSIAASVAAVMFVGLMLLQQHLSQPETMAPVEIAQNLPVEYLEAHQAAAPSSASYYIQSASYNPAEPQK